MKKLFPLLLLTVISFSIFGQGIILENFEFETKAFTASPCFCKHQFVNESISLQKSKLQLWKDSFALEKNEHHCTCKDQSYTIREIQEKLIERGYDVEVNNTVDIKTKAALTQLMRDHNLPVSSFMDIEILKVLGIQW